MLSHIIYNSAATAPMDEQELLELLEHSRNSNAAAGVTGMLLYNDGSFFQVLEGEADVIEGLAARIEQDPRHDRMSVIIREPIHRRSFGEWTMGFAHVASRDLSEIQGLNDFFEGQRILTDIDAGRARKLVSAFGQGRWRVRIANHRPAFAPIVPTSELPQRPAFSVAFQPIVDTSSRSIFAYDAQIRGLDGEPAADVLQRVAIDEIDAFDADSRRLAISSATRLGLSSPLHLPFVPRSLGSSTSNIASTIATAEKCGLEPSRLVLEIKHEVSLIDPQTIAASLRDFRTSGLRICIGDFGSGHAGLGLLEYYQPESISLSMWLVRDVEGNGARQAIVRGLVQTCTDLGIDIIASGVATEEEYSWLSEEGLHLFQGSLFARAGIENLPTPMLPIQ